MRREVLLNYLYICTLSILSQTPRCLTQTAESAASCSDGQVHNNEERTAVELKQNKGRMTDEANLRIRQNQNIGTEIGDAVRPVRRKREQRSVARSVRLQGSSKLLGRAGQTADQHRFKKSNHHMNQNSGELVGKRSNEKISSASRKVTVSEDQANQNKRDLRKQQGLASRSPLSTEEDSKAKSGQKRSSYSSEAVKMSKPKSRAIKESVSVAQGSLAQEKLKVHESGGYAALGNDAEAQKFDSENDQLEDEVDLDEKSAEYDEAGDDDDEEDSEVPVGMVGYKETDPEVSQSGEKSEKPNQGSAEDDDSERQAIVKRESGITREEYEDIEGHDDTCEEAGLIDDTNYQQAKIQSNAGLVKKRGKEDSRVNRHDVEAGGNTMEKNEAVDHNGVAIQQDRGSQLDENVRINPYDISKRAISQTANAAASRSSLKFKRENLKQQAASETLMEDEGNGQADAEVEQGSIESNESSKEEDRLQKEVQTDNRDKTNANEQSNVRLDSEKIGSGQVDKTGAKVAAGRGVDVADDKNSKQESNIDRTAKDDGLYSDYEKRVQEQIQKKIDSIKEEIKREVEEKQRIREIEANNAKYDEIQSEIDEDEDENNQSLEIANERRTISKRSIINDIYSPHIKTKRQILRRVKRSDTTDARKLQALEGVETLDPDILAKAQLRHESIRKRSAPIYGAVDTNTQDAPESLIKRNANIRRVYLVNNEHRRSPIPAEQDVKNTIIIPEQAHVNIEDELPPSLSLDSSLLEDSSSPGKYRLKRGQERFARRRRESAVVPEGKVAFLGYRPEDDDDENDEGNEFDDDGFEDRTSNLRQDQSYTGPRVITQDQYRGEQPRDENPANFLFSGVDRGRNELLVRRKRAGIRDDEEIASLRGGGALARRQTRARSKQMQTAKISSRNNALGRDKRHAVNGLGDTQSDSVASLVGSSQELSPLLAIEYKEAFGGLQSDPGGSLARFKRVRRNALRGSLD